VKLFVWDFHGVLEKDNDLAVLEISNKVLEQAGYKERFSDEDNRKFYGLKWFQYFEKLIPKLSIEECLTLQAACFKFAEENLHILKKHIKPNDHAATTLEAIKLAGHDQIVLSNTRPTDLLWFVSAIGIGKYFPPEKVIGVNAHEKHGTKQDALREYVNLHKPSKLVIIGDSVSDMNLANIAGGVTYFYKHPHINHQDETLSDYIISDLREVLKEL
jgi:phosphoglycolate phosphatase-like HAD superfamily hydrolase